MKRVLEPKYVIGQSFVINGQPCVICEILCKGMNTFEYHLMYKDPLVTAGTWMSERDLSICLLINRNYLTHKDIYEKCLLSAKEIEKEIGCEVR